MMPVIQIGPLALQLPGLLLLMGLWLGLLVAENQASRRQMDPNQLYNLVFTALLGGVLAARLAYLLRYPSAFASSPLSLLSLNPGLLDPWGGAVGTALLALIYGQRKKLPFWPTLDALTPVLAVFAVAQGLAHLAAGTAFGAPAALPWSIELWGALRHPSQIYESLAALLIFFDTSPESLGVTHPVRPTLFLLWPGRERFSQPAPGQSFLYFLALSAAARLFLEAFRGDSALLPGGVRTAQVLAWLVLAAALWGLESLRKQPPSIQPAPSERH